MPEGLTCPCVYGPTRSRQDIERIDRLKCDLVDGIGDAGRQRNAAEVEKALQGGVVRSPHGKRIAVGVVPSGDGIAVVAVEQGAGDGSDGVLVERIAVGVERARNDVDALHAVAGAEADRALNGDGVGRGDLLAGKVGEVGGGDGIDAVERGDVVVAQDGGIGDACAAGRAANAAHGLHHRPAKRAVGFAVGERAGVDLRIVKAEDAAEGALQLEAHHFEQIGVGGAEAVEHDDAVGDGRVGVEVVHPDVDAVVLAGVGLAGGGAEDRVDHASRRRRR